MRTLFHARDEQGLIKDQEGTELSNLAAAQFEAWMSARGFAMEDLRRGGPIPVREIDDEKGNMPRTLPVYDIMD